MTNNYYVIKSCVEEIARRVTGRRIEQVVSFRKSELRILLGEATIVVILQPTQSAIFLNTHGERLPKKNVLHFFRTIEGATFQSIVLDKDDRIVTIETSMGSVVLQLFGDANGWLKENGEITSYFKKPRREVRSIVQRQSSDSLLGKRLIAERTLREMHDIARAATFERELREVCGLWRYGSGAHAMVSPIELRSQSSMGIYVESAGEAVRSVLIERASGAKADTTRSTLQSGIERAIHRNEKALSNIESGRDVESRAEEYRAIANAIIARMNSASVDDEIDVMRADDVQTMSLAALGYREGQPLSGLAERYFGLARRSVERRTELRERYEQLQREQSTLHRLQNDLEQLPVSEPITEIERQFNRLVRQSTQSDTRAATRSSDPLDRFRRFVVAGGCEVLVGKNAAQNDELTLRVARKEDLWLHARGVAGSHVVIRRKSKQKPFSREAIEQAAAIAAYFSDARGQTVAPVSYTERKFVRKGRGAAVGEVKVEREEVVLVRPMLDAKWHIRGSESEKENRV